MLKHVPSGMMTKPRGLVPCDLFKQSGCRPELTSPVGMHSSGQLLKIPVEREHCFTWEELPSSQIVPAVITWTLPWHGAHCSLHCYSIMHRHMYFSDKVAFFVICNSGYRLRSSQPTSVKWWTSSSRSFRTRSSIWTPDRTAAGLALWWGTLGTSRTPTMVLSLMLATLSSGRVSHAVFHTCFLCTAN